MIDNVYLIFLVMWQIVAFVLICGLIWGLARVGNQLAKLEMELLELQLKIKQRQ